MILELTNDNTSQLDINKLIHNIVNKAQLDIDKIVSAVINKSQMNIDNLVSTIIDIYYREDYAYVTGLAEVGKRPDGIKTVKEEVEFIKKNNLDNGLSDEELESAAEIILQEIKVIDDLVYTQYNWLYFREVN